MRNPKRIPIVLERINWDLFLKECVKYRDLLEFLHLKHRVSNRIFEIEKIWKQYPDLRLGQLLINFFEFPDSDKLWNVEEIDYLVDIQGIGIEEVSFWGVNLFKNGTPRKKTKFVLLKDLEDSHVESILNYFNERGVKIFSKYENYFKERLAKNKKAKIEGTENKKTKAN